MKIAFHVFSVHNYYVKLGTNVIRHIMTCLLQQLQTLVKFKNSDIPEMNILIFLIT